MPTFQKYFPYFLMLYHLAFAFVGWQYIMHDHGDATRYWFEGQDLSGKSWLDFLQPGTDVIKIITFPLVKYLKLPFWAGFVIFSAWSVSGIYRLWKILLNLCGENKVLILLSALLLLLPNLHFWTSLIGKEAFLFVPVVLITDHMLKGKYSTFPMISSFVILAVVRPHTAFVFLAACILAVLWKGNISAKAKGILAVAALFGGIALYALLSQITNARQGLFNKIERLYAAHNLKLKATDAYVPLEEYSYPYKMFTFYYRPLPFEKKDFYYQIIGVEDLLFLLISAIAFYGFVRHFRHFKWNVFSVFAVLLLLLYGTMYVYAYANFGMIVRTRVLVMPVFFLLMLHAVRHCGRNGVERGNPLFGVALSLRSSQGH